MRGLTLPGRVSEHAGTIDLPPLERLDGDGLEAIHEASMHIIETLGIQLDHERARAVFRACGAEVGDDDVVTIPRDVIEESLASAPAEFVLHGRNPERNVTVGGDGPPVRAPGYGPPYVYTLGEGRRRSRLSDYELLTKLAHVEDVINCTGYSVCEPTDVDGPEKHFAMLKRSLALSDQPVMATARGGTRARECLDMVGIAVGDRELAEPYVTGLVNTVPPRRIDAEMLAGLMTFAEAGQPLLVSSFTMAGASGPEALPASIAQANAENLVGIALAQQLNPGTPVVYGVPTSNIDTRYGSLTIGSPESALVVAVAAQLGRYYGVPTRAGGSLTDAKTLDYQSGFESMLVGAVTDMADVDYVLHAAGILESYETVSPEKFVLDCEAMRYLDRFRRGFSFDPDDLGLERIAEVEPAGHFLDAARPLGESEAFYHPDVIDKRSHSDWAEDGRRSTIELARDRVERQLEAYEEPRLPPDVERDLEAYVAARGRAVE
ncbi:trimethylamine--corrinoid methyltransferase [Halobacteriales archaeon SW_10_68_16]|jgi:trimethylamine--corrinoid protein Co-methyltransferase|nr:MAG: trimethylamine--corrinoid methyltransferase [Halobacteriales archaeon SW_10_68_16]